MAYLVPIALDADVFVHDHQLDVAAASLLLLHDRLRLVLRDIPEVVKMLPPGVGEVLVQIMSHHIVVAALSREKFALDTKCQTSWKAE